MKKILSYICINTLLLLGVLSNPVNAQTQLSTNALPTIVVPHAQTVSSSDHVISIEVTSNVNYEVSTSVEWLKVLKTANNNIYVYVANNELEEKREGNVIFTNKENNIVSTCTIYQNKLSKGVPNMIASFESYEFTPAYARYGNKPESRPGVTNNSSDPKRNGAEIDLHYKPRWVYSHNVIENPVKNSGNNSNYVLEYTSMEARNYGLKIRFNEPIPIDKITGISLKIYQPSNVLDKPTYNNGPKATKQTLSVKLISSINLVQDYRLEPGLVVDKADGKDIKNFTTENEWVSVYFPVSRELYSDGYEMFPNNVAGIVILPTYGSNTTLSESNVYKCYIDDVVLNITE